MLVYCNYCVNLTAQAAAFSWCWRQQTAPGPGVVSVLQAHAYAAGCPVCRLRRRAGRRRAAAPSKAALKRARKRAVAAAAAAVAASAPPAPASGDLAAASSAGDNEQSSAALTAAASPAAAAEAAQGSAAVVAAPLGTGGSVSRGMPPLQRSHHLPAASRLRSLEKRQHGRVFSSCVCQAVLPSYLPPSTAHFISHSCESCITSRHQLAVSGLWPVL